MLGLALACGSIVAGFGWTLGCYCARNLLKLLTGSDDSHGGGTSDATT